MEALFLQILQWVGENPGWAYGAVFLAALGESLAVLGMVVPGVVMLIGTGALIAAGAIAFWPAFFSAVAGAIVGDGLSYEMGRHFDQHVRSLWPFSRFPGRLQQGVEFFDRYGGWSVALGRFFGPVRAIIPLVAGMMRLPAGRFYFANVSSAIAQTFTYLLPGMLFGASLKLAAEAAVRLAILVIVLVAGVWLCAWAAHRIYLLLAPHASASLRGLLHWADLHPTMGRVAHALADPGHPDAKTLTGLAFLLMLAFFLVGAVTGVALIGPVDLALNRSALDLGQSLHTPLGNRLMLGLGGLGAPSVLLPMVALVFGYLRWRGRLRHAYYWLAAAAFAVVATPVLGALLAVPRPDLGLDLRLPWSFPSGPVLLATTVYGFLAISVARGLPVQRRWVPYGLASVAVAAVAWARIYFGTEWLTDVIGSIALGLAWIAALGLAFRRHSRLDPPWPALAGVALAAVVAGLGVRGWISGDDELARFAPQPRIETLTRDQWLAGDWRRLPERRADLSGGHRHPLTLQYAGDPADFAKALGKEWGPAELLGWGNAIRLLSPSLPLSDLPVIPQVHHGQHESLVRARTGSDGRRQVLRLWSVPFELDDGTPLWVGNLTGQHKEVVLDLIAFPATDPKPPEGSAAELDRVEARLPPDAWLLRLDPETAQ
jgi:membrane protein DedA with SNARE-associated domain/membrane-associated phospholipid phosphatase